MDTHDISKNIGRRNLVYAGARLAGAGRVEARALIDDTFGEFLRSIAVAIEISISQERVATKVAASHAIAIGRLLDRVRGLISPSAFRTWIERTGLDETSASRHLAFAQRVDSQK
jgi:hypothetical protein